MSVSFNYDYDNGYGMADDDYRMNDEEVENMIDFQRERMD